MNELEIGEKVPIILSHLIWARLFCNWKIAVIFSERNLAVDSNNNYNEIMGCLARWSWAYFKSQKLSHVFLPAGKIKICTAALSEKSARIAYIIWK